MTKGRGKEGRGTEGTRLGFLLGLIFYVNVNNVILIEKGRRRIRSGIYAWMSGLLHCYLYTQHQEFTVCKCVASIQGDN